MAGLYNGTRAKKRRIMKIQFRKVRKTFPNWKPQALFWGVSLPAPSWARISALPALHRE